jgi:hypothetical protein
MRKEGVRIEMETQVEVNIKALSDTETCYKFFRKEVLSQIELKEKRFGIPWVYKTIRRIMLLLSGHDEK